LDNFTQVSQLNLELAIEFAKPRAKLKRNISCPKIVKNFQTMMMEQCPLSVGSWVLPKKPALAAILQRRPKNNLTPSLLLTSAPQTDPSFHCRKKIRKI
jgi:hypothetical protein